MKCWLSWSSGKDSAWALHRLRSNPEVEVVGLLTTVNEEFSRVAMHAVREQLLRAQAEATGLALHVIALPFPCSNDDYEQRMGAAVDAARQQGVEAMAFGDLFLEDIRAYREQRLAGTGLEPLFPLWGADTTALAAEMMDGGLRATLTCVDPKQLDARFAGRAWDRALLDELPDHVDPCGERGEFHTLVTDGPMLSAPVAVDMGDVVTRDGFVFADVTPRTPAETQS